MKTLTVVLTKPGKRLVASVRYLHDDWPKSVIFEADRQAFLHSEGTTGFPLTVRLPIRKVRIIRAHWRSFAVTSLLS